MAETKSTRLTIGSPESPVRFSFLKAFVPEEVENDEGVKSLKYSTQIIISKKDTATVEAINKMVKHVVDEEWEEKGEAVKGCWFFNCSSKQKPAVVGTQKNDLTGKLEPLGPDEIKSGDYGRVSLNFFDFTGKSKGVGVGLGNIQKLKDGEPLGNQRSADDDFGDLADGFED